MHFHQALATYTSDSGGESLLTVTHNEFGTRVGKCHIYLRHQTDNTFLGVRGTWVIPRAAALRFATNLDAIVYSELLKLGGRVTGIDDAGRQLYELDVAVILGKTTHHRAGWTALPEGQRP